MGRRQDEAERALHPDPVPYHLMLRTTTYSWWKPFVGVLLVGVGFVVLASIVFEPVAAVWALFQEGPFRPDYLANRSRDPLAPARFLGLNLGLASMIALVGLVMRMHGLRLRWLTSVVPRMRWRLLAVCLGLAVVAVLVQVVVGSRLPAAAEGEPTSGVNPFSGTSLAFLLVVLLTTPLQAAGEEYLFRGYLLQAFGSLFASKWVAIGASSVIFALLHGGQNFPLFFDRLAFGLLAGWLVVRTGGLEAGLALHVVNNFLAFGVALAFGDITSALTVSEVSWWNIVITVVRLGVFTALVLLATRGMGLRTRTPAAGEGAGPRPEEAASTP